MSQAKVQYWWRRCSEECTALRSLFPVRAGIWGFPNESKKLWKQWCSEWRKVRGKYATSWRRMTHCRLDQHPRAVCPKPELGTRKSKNQKKIQMLDLTRNTYMPISWQISWLRKILHFHFNLPAEFFQNWWPRRDLMWGHHTANLFVAFLDFSIILSGFSSNLINSPAKSLAHFFFFLCGVFGKLWFFFLRQLIRGYRLRCRKLIE